jgi:YHS domain-containing protein
MRGLLTFLLYGLFFYLIMRFGCGAHMVHGHGGHGHESHGDNDDLATDPVCGMTVAPGQGYTKAYQGKMLHFCSRDCLDKFEADPQRYLAQKGVRP